MVGSRWNSVTDMHYCPLLTAEHGVTQLQHTGHFDQLQCAAIKSLQLANALAVTQQA
jgi:hypothetical protein